MYTHESSSDARLRSTKQDSDGEVDLDANWVSWLTNGDANAMAPFEIMPPRMESGGGFSFEAFPHQLPPLDGELQGSYTPEPTMRRRDQPQQHSPVLFGGRRPQVPDVFGFPTELQLSGAMSAWPDIPEATEDPFQGSVEYSSTNNSNNKKISKPLSSAQVKNRKAQKRFREKQKAKMLNLEEEVEALRKRVETLSVENRELGNSNMLLNKVVSMRDRQMSILKVKTESLMEKKVGEGTANGKIPELLMCSDETLSLERSLTVANHLSKNFPASKFASIDNVHMRAIWKRYVDALSDLLINHESDPENPDILEKISIAVGELGEICMQCATLCPTSICSLVATGDTEFAAPVDSEDVQTFWQNVVTSLRLMPDQELLLLALRKRFFHHLETIWKTRTLLSNRLQSYVMSKDDVFKSNRYSCRNGSGVRAVFEELRETCMIDCQYHTDFIGSFFQVVLNDLQTARVFVESFPYYPDVLQISNLIHKKHQEEEEQDQQQPQESSSFTAASPTVSLTTTSRVYRN